MMRLDEALHAERESQLGALYATVTVVVRVTMVTTVLYSRYLSQVS